MEIMCKECGKSPAVSKGLCKKCYCKKYHREHYVPVPKRDRRGEKTKKIIAEFALGKSQSELAKEFNVSRQYISQIIKKAGLKKC